MQKSLSGKKIAILVADGFEQVELTAPKEALEQAGAQTYIISKNDKVQGMHGMEKMEEFPVDVKLSQADERDYDALVLPGGVQNPDKLRQDPHALEFVQEFVQAKKKVAAICHGPWTLIDAGVVAGKRMTSYHSIKTDLQNAGALWVDEEVVVDQGLITSRHPGDLPAFCQKIIEEFAEGIHSPQKERVKKLGELLKDIHIAMLTTQEFDGSLRSRPMATQIAEFDGVLWFFTQDPSPKSEEILINQQVNLSYANPEKERYVSVSGKATLVRDRAKAKQLWSPFYKIWFPEGVDDPNLALLQVVVEQAEYWDAPLGKMVMLLGFAKSLITKKPYQSNQREHGKLIFQK